MFREMRRKDKQLTNEETMKILTECEYCVLATVGEDGTPYSTPLSYVVVDQKVYFHGSTSGQKLDNIANNPKICLNVVRGVEAVWDNDFTTYFESVTAFGTAKMLEESELKRKVLIELCDKYLPEHIEKADGIIESTKNVTSVVEITISHITGKAKKR